MAPMVAAAPAVRHLERLQTLRPAQAKADLKKVQAREAWPALGLAMAHAVALSHHSRKEAAGRIDRSEQQLAGMIAATERPQIELFLADDVLRGPMLIALAHQSGEFDVVTTITIRRTA